MSKGAIVRYALSVVMVIVSVFIIVEVVSDRQGREQRAHQAH